MKLCVILSLLALSGSVVASSPTGTSPTHDLQLRQTKCGGEECDDKTQECKEVDNKPKCVCRDGYAFNMDRRCVKDSCAGVTCDAADQECKIYGDQPRCACKDGKIFNQKGECFENPCGDKECPGDGQECRVVNDEAQCSCKSGYIPSDFGGHCINPCDTFVCGKNEECELFKGIECIRDEGCRRVQRPGCICKSGSTPTQERGCVKNDELESCDLTYCGVYAECRVVDDNPTCVCKAGSHRVKGRCGPNRDYCGALTSFFSCPFFTSEKCIYSGGDRYCVCPDGYSYNDKNGCVEDSKTDPCESVQCDSTRECKEIEDNASCVCKEGYKPGPNHLCVKESLTKRGEPKITSRKLAYRFEDRCKYMVCDEDKECKIRDGKPVCRSSVQK